MLSFTQESCLRNINADLHHYYRFLSAQPLLNTTVLSSVKELMQVIYLSIYLNFMLFLNQLKILIFSIHVLNRYALHGTLSLKK